MNAPVQPNLFDDAPTLPAGFRYRPELITPSEEQALICELQRLPFKPFDFHGFFGRRQVVSFGWRYDYTRRAIQEVEPIPPFLQPLRERIAVFAETDQDAFVHKTRSFKC